MSGAAPSMFASSPPGDDLQGRQDSPRGDARDRDIASHGDARDRGVSPRDDGADLVQRCARDDPAAMREIVSRYQAKLARYLFPLIGAREDVEEAVLDVFLRVWRDAHRFERRASVSTWIYRIATNVAYDRLRRQKAVRRTPPPADWADTTAADAEAVALGNLEARERAGLLDRCLQRMRVDDRLLLTLYYGEEMDYDEIAAITKSPGPLLRVRMMRARRRLRDLMVDLAPEENE